LRFAYLFLQQTAGETVGGIFNLPQKEALATYQQGIQYAQAFLRDGKKNYGSPLMCCSGSVKGFIA